MKQIYKVISIFVILMLATTQIVGAYGGDGGSAGGSLPSVTVKTDKTIYYLGDPVTITVKNGLNQPINFNEIMVKNMITGTIINTLCSSTGTNDCLAIGIIVRLDPGQTYTTTWYPPGKGIYKAYVDWWTEGTATCMAIGCPEPEPGISGTTYSKYFRIR